MPNSTAPPHPDATNNTSDSEDEHTLTAFGDVSLTEEQMLDSATNEIRCLNRLRLKVKRPPFPKNRSSVQYSPKKFELAAVDSRESIPSGSSVSCNYEPGQSMIVKDVPSVAEAATGWRKLPPRLPIPKWDADD
ncbi:hypothetical protein DFJ58DRAFT_850463 [Suillus subalutaceus]|uniref:uncharacterized protein n=1 Tax=Suillus subalutaceus TaxID=48586 RepID=UPI001B885DB7|nr:uncharacterized protein DFJ58DRAFT_850463 [Suillus subalutaceus]KAG1816296.1 hypothetical protein DFJ58DRAFT_850463 [Suillus subalutaceus]